MTRQGQGRKSEGHIHSQEQKENKHMNSCLCDGLLKAIFLLLHCSEPVVDS